MFKLNYFCSKESFSANDFKSNEKTVFINLKQVSSISGLKEFRLPFSGSYIGEYAVLKMKNGDVFNINEKEQSRILKVLTKKYITD